MTTTIATDHPFSADEQTQIARLAGLMVPASEAHGVPGADDAQILADILRTACADEARVRAALEFAGGLGLPLEAAVPRLQGAVEMLPLVVVVMQCYYRDDRVMRALGMEARPPFPEGFDVPQGDWSLLEAVQRRGRIWRDA